MQRLKGLPRMMHITHYGKELLIIDNYKYVYDSCLFNCLLDVIRWGDWETVLPQMVLQGFNFENAVDELILNIKDPGHFSWMVYWFCLPPRSTIRSFEELSQSSAGNEIKTECLMIIRKCKNWDDFYFQLRIDSVFRKNMNEKIIAEGIKQ